MQNREVTDSSSGTIVWAKLGKYPWWPGILIDASECGMQSTSQDFVWVYWLDDQRVSNVCKSKVMEFKNHFNECFHESKLKTYQVGVTLAIKEVAKGMCIDTEAWTKEKCLTWAKEGFKKKQTHKRIHETSELIPEFVKVALTKIKKYKMEEEERPKTQQMNMKVKKTSKQNLISSLEVPHSTERKAVNLEDIQKVKQKSVDISAMCLSCKSIQVELICPHPLFKGSLCRPCKDYLRKSMFVTGDDGAYTSCAICGNGGNAAVCSDLNCQRVYCKTCVDLLGNDGASRKIRNIDPWKCFTCADFDISINGLIERRNLTKRKCAEMAKFFHSFGHIELYPKIPDHKEGITVLSLFDGISTGLVVLQKLKFKINKYIASEIHADGIKVSCANNYGNIQHIGDVRLLTNEKLKSYGKIDLLIGGSPCGELSLVNPARKGLYDAQATGILFFEYCRILRQLQQNNKNHHLFWLFENTAAMPQDYFNIMNRHLGCEAVLIDAAWFSAQKRARYFWGNIPELGKQLSFQEDSHILDECLDPGLNRVATVKKLRTVTTQSNSLYQGKHMAHPVKEKGQDSLVTSTELERVFGFPAHYTDVANLSAPKRQKLLGQAWSVPVICHILKPLKAYFLCDD